MMGLDLCRWCLRIGTIKPVVQLLQHPNARDLEVSDSCKEVYYLREEEVVENDWEILGEELVLVLVGVVVEVVGRLAGQNQEK